jgi:putative heme-binding domain-containing protein
MKQFCLLTFSCLSGLLAAAALAQPPTPKFKTAPGFAVERIYSVPRDSQGSWVALAADRAGRLYAADQYGPLYRLTPPRKPDESATAETLSLRIGGAHGLTWIGPDLYVVAGQKAVCPTGLYRLRDTNSDGELDEVQLLRELDGDGEHGPHAVMPSPDGRSLYVLAGNATKLPELVRSRVPPLWAEDSLLPPLPAVVGSETRGRLGGGWICRTDLDGRAWELVSLGLRNAYALAVDARGELFTFDSDTELEINLPWYRPTRVLHAVSGADFGWRRGAFKVPETAPDGWPAVLPLGLGSPTAVLFPRAARLPEKYRTALWVADWSYGRITALYLTPKGATYTAIPEEILSSIPLPITAICTNPVDGALYFATGGRRTQSAIYRLTWQGEIVLKSEQTPEIPPAVQARLALEEFHGRTDSAAAAAVWPALASADPLVRRSARTALESQPVAAWRERALAERDPRTALAALLALARTAARENHAPLLAALARHWTTALSADLQAEAMRVLSLTLTRGGELSPADRTAWAARLTPLFPSGNPTLDATLLELLVALRAPAALDRGFSALTTAVTREAQLDLARSLRARFPDFTPTQRRDYLTWLHRTGGWRGGPSFSVFLKELRKEAVALAPESERASLEKSLATSTTQSSSPVASLPEGRGMVRAWTAAELVALAAKDSGPRDLTRGRQAFGMAGCFACHAAGGEGGALGPDLTSAGSRYSPRDLIEAIIEPSREISDQYGTSLVTLRDGRQLSGRIINYTEQGISLAENLFDPAQATRLKESEIVSIEASKISLMPPGLLDVLQPGEILDLLAFLSSAPQP